MTENTCDYAVYIASCTGPTLCARIHSDPLPHASSILTVVQRSHAINTWREVVVFNKINVNCVCAHM